MQTAVEVMLMTSVGERHCRYWRSCNAFIIRHHPDCCQGRTFLMKQLHMRYYMSIRFLQTLNELIRRL